MRKKTIRMTLDDFEYNQFLGDLYREISKGKLTLPAANQIVQKYVDSESEKTPSLPTIILSFDSITSLEIFARKLSRLGTEEKVKADNLGEKVRNIAEHSYGLKAAGLLSHPIPFIPLGDGDPTPPAEKLKKLKKDRIRKEKILLERKVKEAMNSIALGNKTEIDTKQLEFKSVQELARNYFLDLLNGRYKIIETEYPLPGNKKPQILVYQALRAYLPFRRNDVHFLFNNPERDSENNPDRPIAQLLVAKVRESIYTNVQMARIPFIVLLSEPNLKRMPGYDQFKKIIESSQPKDFKDTNTLAYINGRLQREVLLAATRLYNIPEKEE